MNQSKRTLNYLLLILSLILVQSCDLLNPDGDDDQKPPEPLAKAYYILCEGNFGQANASLWSVDETLNTVGGPHIWDPNINPLGDVGQSMCLNGDDLYIIMNNSHEIKVMDLKEGPTHVEDILLPDAGPRYMAVQNSMNRAFVSCWSLAALLVIDLSNNSVVDTLELNALPEELIIRDDLLYVSLTMNTDWSANNQVLELDIASDEPVLERSFTVLDGPGSMAYSDSILYVTSIAYDASWAAVTGTSTIDLQSGLVTHTEHGTHMNYTADVDVLNGVPYRVYGRSVLPMHDNGGAFASEGAIGNLPNIYSFSVINDRAIIATSDYASPDTVHFFSDLGVLESSIAVAAFPRDIVFYDPNE